MIRRLFAALISSFAIFVLTATFFVWVVDESVLNKSNLTDALRRNGVHETLARVIPDLVTQGVPLDQQKIVRNATAKVLDQKYIDERVTSITDGMIGYIKGILPPPSLDLTDLGKKLEAYNAQLPADTLKTLSKPLQVKGSGVFAALPKAYKTLRIFKIVGPIIAIVLLFAEWFLSGRSNRIRRMGSISLHVGLWAIGYGVVIYIVPKLLDSKLSNNAGVISGLNGVLDKLVGAAKDLVGKPFIALIIGSVSLALILFFTSWMVGKKKAKNTPKSGLDDDSTDSKSNYVEHIAKDPTQQQIPQPTSQLTSAPELPKFQTTPKQLTPNKVVGSTGIPLSQAAHNKSLSMDGVVRPVSQNNKQKPVSKSSNPER